MLNKYYHTDVVFKYKQKKLFFDTVTDIDKVTKPMELVPMPAPNLIKTK